MNPQKETALKNIKKAKYGAIPLYILLVMLYFIIGLKESSLGWVLLGLGIGLLWSAVLPLTLFTGLLWVQYILEGYVKVSLSGYVAQECCLLLWLAFYILADGIFTHSKDFISVPEKQFT